MSISAVREAAARYQEISTAPLGFAFRDLVTGETVAFHGDEVFPTASMYKVYILAELIRKVGAGECSLSDRIPYDHRYRAIGSGVLKDIEAGVALTLRDYATLMMILSDNSATNFLFHFVGRDNIVKNVLEPLGFSGTKCDFDCSVLIDQYFELNGGSVKEKRQQNGGKLPSYRNSPWYCCTTEENNCTTPMEALRMFELLYRGEWVSPELSKVMLDIMLTCQTNRRIPRLLPVGTEVAHKTGTLDRLAVDTGIVYTPKGDFILCLFYNGNLADEATYEANLRGDIGEDLLAELSRDIYNAYCE